MVCLFQTKHGSLFQSSTEGLVEMMGIHGVDGGRKMIKNPRKYIKAR